MKISEIRIYRCDEPKVRAYVMFTIDDCFVVRGIRLIQGPRGLFLAWPSRRRHDGTYEDYVHVLIDEAYARLEAAILQAYEDGDEACPPIELPVAPARRSDRTDPDAPFAGAPEAPPVT